MANPGDKLAEALEALQALQQESGVAIRSSDLTRLHRERLLRAGFLKEVMKGWYVPAHPNDLPGESTAWYAAFWEFCAAYLEARFGSEWCLSAEQSLSLHAGNRAVPRQLIVRAPKGGNKPTALPYDTSLLDVRTTLPDAEELEQKDGLRLFTLPAALVSATPAFFNHNPIDARAALTIIRDASEALGKLLDGGHSVIAGRLAGAFRNIGRARIANDILKTMRAAGYTVREEDPFEHTIEIPRAVRTASPHVSRNRLMWQAMRGTVEENFPPPRRKARDIETYLKRVEDAYVTDAYHSLSIEGYRVSPDLIERVRSGAWNPERNESDGGHRDALAARGYWQAFQEVKKSVRRVLQGANPGTVAEEDHGAWYRELFAPSVTAGLIATRDLAGYRSGPVFIRHSRHVPPRSDAVRETMPDFFELLKEEMSPAVRIVLGHYLFVYIHPYMDGNGRMGRFLMNLMMAAGGYPWTVVPVERRAAYMEALEHASVSQDIAPFTKFLGELVSAAMEGKPTAMTPGE